MMPKVSSIIATYHNPPRYSDREYVGECCASIRAQTHQPVRVVVVDGSPDVRMGNSAWNPKAAGLADVFGALPRLTGRSTFADDVCSSFQFGVHLTRTDWIIPMNADDRLGPHFVERALIAAKTQAPSGYVPGVVVVSAAPLSAAIERDNYIPYLAMFARWFWDEMGGFQDVLELGGPCLLADWDLWIRIWQRYGDAAPIAYVDDPSVIQIRNREGSASKWTSDEFERLRGELWKRRGIAS